jgi:very-short-patch-repair endonuclease
MATRQRSLFRDAKPPSRLEKRFELLWQQLSGPELEKEFRFHPVRKWRADFAHLGSRTLIEIEGGIYINGRHNRPAGFAADLEKYFEASLAGWRVVRLGPKELTLEHLERLVALIVGGKRPHAGLPGQGTRLVGRKEMPQKPNFIQAERQI